MSSSKRFFKFILCSALHDHKLKIPDSFVKKYGDELSDSAKLIGPTGSIYCVGVEKTGNRVWLHDGLHKFMEDYSVGFGYVLMFKYKGNSTFKVYIFDLIGSEVEYSKVGELTRPDDALITRSGDVNQYMTRCDGVHQLSAPSNDVNQFTTRSDDVDQLTARCDEVNQLTARGDDVPQVTARRDDVPQVTARCNDVPQVTARCDDVPQVSTRCDDVPLVKARSGDVNLLPISGLEKDDAGHYEKSDDDSSIEVLGYSADHQVAESSELMSRNKRKRVVSAGTWKPIRSYLTRSKKRNIQDRGGSSTPRNKVNQSPVLSHEVTAGTNRKSSSDKFRSIGSITSRNVRKSK